MHQKLGGLASYFKELKEDGIQSEQVIHWFFRVRLRRERETEIGVLACRSCTAPELE